VLADLDGPPELLVDAPGPHDLAFRDWPHGDETVEGFEAHSVLDALSDAMHPEVKLGAGSMFIEPTRALVAVDVNTGGDFSPAAGLKVNLAMAKALPLVGWTPLGHFELQRKRERMPLPLGIAD